MLARKRIEGFGMILVGEQDCARNRWFEQACGRAAGVDHDRVHAPVHQVAQFRHRYARHPQLQHEAPALPVFQEQKYRQHDANADQGRAAHGAQYTEHGIDTRMENRTDREAGAGPQECTGDRKRNEDRTPDTECARERRCNGVEARDEFRHQQ